ncbi:MAG: NADH-quinone oxidoreductase subunit C [Desulfocapsaceae bacterium]|jgi:NADH-quinone oxidoreductase subunit C|nr:NADH-quinone oxidoreductase subunit C [Desulfocapsaceae bacterium]
MNIQETTQQRLSELFKAIGVDTGENRLASDQSTDGQEQETPPRLPGIIEMNYAEKGFHLDVLIEQEQLLRAAEIMFDLGYFLESITGVDWIKEDLLEAVYDFSRYDFNLCRVAVRVFIPRLAPHLPTITGVYTGANWHERETHDFFGIVFDGHPHLIPLLLPEDADFHPLLKDFKA